MTNSSPPFSLIIVDDEAAIRESLKDIFPWSDLGFSIAATFDNGYKALAYLSINKCDAILTDVKMPIMSGLELVKQVRLKNKEIQIVILSAYEEFTFIQEAISLGVFDYLVKPVSYQDVTRIFKRLCAKMSGVEIKKVTLDSYSLKTFLDENLRNATFENTANHFEISTEKLSTFISQEFSTSFNSLLVSRKMEKAQAMLMLENIRISEVADATGYTNANNFTRAFIKYFGINPTKWRKAL